MGGKVIETEAKKILNYGISQGLRQGVSEGLTQGKILGAIEFAKGMNMSEEQIVEQIVKKIGLSEDEARKKFWKFRTNKLKKRTVGGEDVFRK